MDFSEKTVLITGATGLIGSTLAETFSQAGTEGSLFTYSRDRMAV